MTIGFSQISPLGYLVTLILMAAEPVGAISKTFGLSSDTLPY